MKRTIVVVLVALFMAVGSLVIPHNAYAVGFCGGEWEIYCRIKGDRSKTIATTNFTMCWSWKHLECRPCRGGGEWSHFAKWCNENYAGCKNKCWGCSESFGAWSGVLRCVCYDKNGNCHDCPN